MTAKQADTPLLSLKEVEALCREVTALCDRVGGLARKARESGAVLVEPGELVADVTINDTTRTMILDARPSFVAEYLEGLAKLWKKRGVTQDECDALNKAVARAEDDGHYIKTQQGDKP